MRHSQCYQEMRSVLTNSIRAGRTYRDRRMVQVGDAMMAEGASEDGSSCLDLFPDDLVYRVHTSVGETGHLYRGLMTHLIPRQEYITPRLPVDLPQIAQYPFHHLPLRPANLESSKERVMILPFRASPSCAKCALNQMLIRSIIAWLQQLIGPGR
jgi:hypothetical protein